jgi:KipI family sensor histidine kinase inhibitor
MRARFLLCGDTAVTVEFGDGIDRVTNEAVLRLDALVRAAALPGVIETVPTFRSLTVHYDPLAADPDSVITAIERLADGGRIHSKPSRLWRVPACYARQHAPDLADVAHRTGLSIDDIVRLHSGTRFHVYMLGFAPGYAYMGDLPEAMVLPRRTDPRTRVPAGSIAIATSMTAVYPVESPGGWHLIGTTPIRLFDPRRSQPALFKPGDSVRFQPIGMREFDAIREAVAQDDYEVPCEEVEA